MNGLASVNATNKKAAVLFEKFPPSANLSVAVILPARNEADFISGSLDALRQQVDHSGLPLQAGIYEVLLLANNCTDATIEIVNNYRAKYPGFLLRVESVDLPTADAHIGTVRRMLMDAACRRFDLINSQAGIIASTDSDSIVDSKWICQISHEIRNGADAVGGRILTMESTGEFFSYQEENETYRNLVSQVDCVIDPVPHDPWPRHFQYFGANMAVSKSMYEAIGGIPALRYLEDNALHDALFRNDARIRRSPNVLVTTSARTNGRVEIGFSEQLRRWSEMHDAGKPQEVVSGKELVKLMTLKRKLRDCWKDFQSTGVLCNIEITAISDDLKIDRNWLKRQFYETNYFGALWMAADIARSKGSWSLQYPSENINAAIAFLQNFLVAREASGRD